MENKQIVATRQLYDTIQKLNNLTQHLPTHRQRQALDLLCDLKECLSIINFEETVKIQHMGMLSDARETRARSHKLMLDELIGLAFKSSPAYRKQLHNLARSAQKTDEDNSAENITEAEARKMVLESLKVQSSEANKKSA